MGTHTICRILTTGESQEVGLPGECHEHASNSNAGQRTVETPEPSIDVFKRSCETESCREKQEWSELGTKSRMLCSELWGPGKYPKDSPCPETSGKLCSIKDACDTHGMDKMLMLGCKSYTHLR